MLVCDDEPMLRDLLASHLCMNGYSVIEASDGVDCLYQVTGRAPDAIFLDVNMPRMNGIEVAKLLREKKVDCPVIFITSQLSQDQADKLESLGNVDFLAKPFPMSQLQCALDKHFAT